MFSQKAQESAPFELLVAVIIMAFVLFVGLNAIIKTNQEQCFAQIDKSLEEFKVKMEIAVTQKSPQTIFLKLSDCFNPEDEEIIIRDHDNALFCADLCGTAEITCTSLNYINKTQQNLRIIQKCLNISPETVFPANTSAGRCVDSSALEQQFQQEFVPQDFKSGIFQGNYLLINKTLATDTFPTVCAYLRVQ
jgi:hypothetical protein